MNDEFDGYSSDFLEARRGQLLDLRAEITGRSRETLQQIMDQEREVGDSVDTSNEEQDTSTMLRLQDREASLLTEIEAALRRFEDDEYGECVECGDYINPRRLEARPAASMCIGCQEEVEALGRRQLSRPGLIDEYM